MKIRQLENNQDIDKIKEILTDLSVDWNDTKEWFKDYPLENLDIFKDFIIQSPLSLWAFETKRCLLL